MPNFLILFSKFTHCFSFLLRSQSQSRAFSFVFYSLLLQNHGHQLQPTPLSIKIIACCYSSTKDLIVINLPFQLPGHIFALRYLISLAAMKLAGRRDFTVYFLIYNKEILLLDNTIAIVPDVQQFKSLNVFTISPKPCSF